MLVVSLFGVTEKVCFLQSFAILLPPTQFSVVCDSQHVSVKRQKTKATEFSESEKSLNQMNSKFVCSCPAVSCDFIGTKDTSTKIVMNSSVFQALNFPLITRDYHSVPFSCPFHFFSLLHILQHEKWNRVKNNYLVSPAFKNLYVSKICRHYLGNTSILKIWW